MDKVFMKLAQIEIWLDSTPDVNSFKTNDDFMSFLVEAMNHVRALLTIGVSMASDEVSAKRGVTKRKAIILGHMVRLVKLYDGLSMHTAQNRLELANIFTRLIYETAVRSQYLMRSKNRSFKQYVLSSYKPEREMLTDLAEKASKRPLTQIEKRMRRKVKEKLKEDGISVKALLANRYWNLDGKDFRRIMEDVGYGPVYAYGFGCSSHQIHGDWFDISTTHLNRVGRFYTADLSWGRTEPRIAGPLTLVCLTVLWEYLKWNKSDPDNAVTFLVEKMLEIIRDVEDAHEVLLGE